MFGNPLESTFGTKRFLWYYFTCVVGAGLTHLLMVPNESAVGASGGIYGLLIAFGLVYPDSIISLFFILPMKAIHAVIFIALLALASAMGTGGSRIAHFAHLVRARAQNRIVVIVRIFVIRHMHADQRMEHECISDGVYRALELQLVKINHRHDHDAGFEPLKTDRADQAVADAQSSQLVIGLPETRIIGIRSQVNELFTHGAGKLMDHGREMVPVLTALAVDNDPSALPRQGPEGTVRFPVLQEGRHEYPGWCSV